MSFLPDDTLDTPWGPAASAPPAVPAPDAPGAGGQDDPLLAGLNPQQLQAVQSRAQALASQHAVAHRESWSGEFAVQHKDGTMIPVVATDDPIFDRRAAPN